MFLNETVFTLRKIIIMIDVNEYFNGGVKSLAYTTPNGKSTVGVMVVGDYEFGTSNHETMTVVEGELVVILPGESESKSFVNGDVFTVDAGQTFQVKATVDTSYLCVYR